MENKVFRFIRFFFILVLGILFSQTLFFCPIAFSTDQPPVPLPPSPPYLQKPVDPNFDGVYLLDWSDVDCACSYKIQEADNPQFSNATNFSVPAGASQKLFTKTAAGTFYYQVKASAYCSGIGKKEDFLKDLFAWFKSCFIPLPAYAGSPCNPADINTNWGNTQSIAVVKPTSYIDGVVYQTDTELAISDAVVTSPDFTGSVTTGADGKFSFSFQTFFPESGKLNVTIDIEKSGYTSAQGVVEVVASRHSAVNPIFLTTLDPVTTTITPDGGTHTNSTGEIELVFPAGAVTEATEVNSTKYQKGKALPNDLPETTFFTYALNLKTETSALYKGQKKKVTAFQEPITMRVANTLGFAPGTPIPDGVYNEETKQWEDTGVMGQVSADGQWLEFQIDHFSSHDLNLPTKRTTTTNPPPVTKNSVKETVNNQDVARDPGVSVRSGTLNIEHSLPGIKRLNKDLSLVFSYNSNTASPSEFISIETNLNNATTAVPATTTFTVDFAGKIASATYTGVSGDVRYAYLFDGKAPNGDYLPTGSYPYKLKISNNYAELTYWTTDKFGGAPIADTGIPAVEPVPIPTEIKRKLTINNQRNSPFGAGWTIQGLDRIYPDPNGDLLLAEGNGSSAVFTNTSFIYVTDSSYNISVVNPKNNTQIDQVQTGGYSSGRIVFTPDGTRSYISIGNASFNGILVVDTRTNEAIDIIPVLAYGFPGNIAISPDGKFAYVSGYDPGILILDIQKDSPTYHTLIGEVTTPDVVMGMKFNSSGSLVYATCPTVSKFIIIDTKTKQVAAQLQIGGYSDPWELALTSDEKKAYVTDDNLGKVYVIDIDTSSSNYLTVIGTINIGVDPIDIAIQKQGYLAYVSNTVAVSVIDIRTDQVIKTIYSDDGLNTGSLDLSPNDNFLYVVESPMFTKAEKSRLGPTAGDDRCKISVIDTITNERVAKIQLFNLSWPSDLAISPVDIFRSPEGDYSILEKNVDNSFTRTLKDGTKINFNSEGLQTSVVDRNGNTTYYQYTDANADAKAEELSRIILPTGAYYQLTYTSAGKLEFITDPAGRVTQFTIDANSDLTGITNPDTTTKSFAYTNHLLTSATNERTFATSYEYDNYGRVKKMLFPNSPQEVLQFFPSETQGLINDLALGVGTPTNPAPVVRPADIVERIIDGNGYTTSSQTSKFGSYNQTKDALNQITVIERDRDNNPLKITRPNSSTVSMTYDGKGNLLASTEDIISATTAFTYEPNFNQIKTITDARNNATAMDYDSKGNPVQVTDALGNITKMEYNFRSQVTKTISGFGTSLENQTQFSYYPNTGNLQSITDPLGDTTTFTYDSDGNILTTTDAKGNTATFEYDSMNRLTKVTDPDSKITQYQYDETGNLKKIIDAKLNETNFTYDEINQLKTITNPLNKTKTFTHDLNRNLSSVTDFKGQTIVFSYDEINRLTGKLANSQTIASFGYDTVNNLTLTVTPESSLTLGYDLASRLTSAITADLGHQPATTISFTFDKNSNRLTLTDPQSVITKYVYDALNRLTDITNNSDVNITHFGFDGLSRRTALNFPNNTSTAYGYDLASRLTSLVTTGSNPKSQYYQIPNKSQIPNPNKLISSIQYLRSIFDLSNSAFAASQPQSTSINLIQPQTTINSYTYTYDNVGNRLTMIDSYGTHNYTYDNLYRLTNATLPTESFAYDQVGNRNPASFVYDAANRLLDDGTYTYTYDDNGNCATKTNKSNPTDVTSYTYNIENQLIRVTGSSGNQVDYTYDGLGRRIEKNVNGTITRYVYYNEDIIAEYDGSNILQAKYLHGPGVDEPLRMTRGGQNYFYHADGLGSVTAITNSTGATVKTYRYDAFGNIINETGTLANPYAYTGREYDSETGLYYYRARYYDARVGRFLQEDPIAYLGGINLYVYVTNNPLNRIDPLGLCETNESWSTPKMYAYNSSIPGLNGIIERRIGSEIKKHVPDMPSNVREEASKALRKEMTEGELNKVKDDKIPLEEKKNIFKDILKRAQELPENKELRKKADKYLEEFLK